MRSVLFSLVLLLGTAGAVYAQRTGDAERAGWYSTNPWMLALIIIPLVALAAVGLFLLLRRKL